MADRELGPADEVLAPESAAEPGEAPVVAQAPASAEPPPEQTSAEEATREATGVEETSDEETSGDEITGEALSGEAAPDVYVWAVPEGADEDEGWEEEEDFDGPDPFIRGEPLDDEAIDLDLEARRASARLEALGGEQRIYMRTPAGPGSLAEALNQLMAEGRVQAEFVDDTEDEPHILYRPVK